jgi:hypothetical protein
MQKRHTPGVQRLPRNPFVGRTVNVVTDERPSSRCHVNSDLVGSACQEFTPDEGYFARSVQEFIVGAAFLTGRIDHDTAAIGGTAAERQGNRPRRRLRRAVHDREVLLPYAPAGAVALDLRMDFSRDGYEHDARGTFVEARDDPRLDVTVRARRVPTAATAEMPQKPVEERSRPVLISRVDDHSRRFVYGDQMLILIQNHEADWLRFGGRAPRRELDAL